MSIKCKRPYRPTTEFERLIEQAKRDDFVHGKPVRVALECLCGHLFVYKHIKGQPPELIVVLDGKTRLPMLGDPHL